MAEEEARKACRKAPRRARKGRAATTHAAVKVADYPFTTIVPQPGMWDQDDLQIELVDTPPLTPEQAKRLVAGYVEHYNTVRLHSAIGFVTPADMLAGRQQEIHAARDRKLEEARRQRQLRRPRPQPPSAPA